MQLNDVMIELVQVDLFFPWAFTFQQMLGGLDHRVKIVADLVKRED